MSSIVGVSFGSRHRLTPMQRALWTSQRLHPDEPVQNMALVTHLDGLVDPARLADAFTQVVRSSDVLRTRIVEVDGTPQVSLDAEPQEPLIIAIERDDVERWARERVANPLDLSVRGFDSVILTHPDHTVSWYLDLHHTITDATSSSLVFDATAAVYRGESIDLASYYRWAARTTGEPTGSVEPTEPATSANDRRRRQALDYWQQREPAPGLARLYKPVREPIATADRLDVELSEAMLANALQRLTSDYKLLSPDLAWTALLTTTTAAYLHHVSGVDRFSIGLPVHNRADAETRSLVGPIMEVFPVDISIEQGQSFRALHKAVSRSIMTTLSHAVAGAAPAADYAAVVNVIPRAAVGSFGSMPTSTRWVHSGAIDSNHLLRVQLTAYTDDADQQLAPTSATPDSSGPQLALDINTGAAEVGHLDRAPGHFRALFGAMVAEPDQPIATSIVEDDELALLTDWETASDFPTAPPSVVSSLRRSLTASGASIVLRQDDRIWTGAELERWIDGTARWLREQGVGRGDRVGIELARSAEAVVAIMATLAVGGSFVPLALTQPSARRRSLAKRAGCAVIVSDLPSVDTLPPGSGSWFEPDADDEAYLLFTSGSTGQPKGVPITHGGLARYLRFAAESYLAQHDQADTPLVVPLFSSLGFDLTITSLFLPLIAGGELIVIAPEGPPALSAIADEGRITWCKATPSHLEVLVRLLPADHQLSTVVVGGEAFGSGLARSLFGFSPDLAIYNEYGPTEAVVGCMIHRLDPEAVDRHLEVPIGRPAPGVTLRVVRSNGDRVPIGAVGELLISHVGLTTGYLGDLPPKTGSGANSQASETLVDDPFITLDGERFYRSGDLVRLADAETLIYLGRVDEQVKVGGIRLEPTEVSDALSSHPAIGAAAVRLWSPQVRPPDRRCVRCGLDSNVPGVTFDAGNLCSSCHAYERVAPQAESWFKTLDDLRLKQRDARSRRTGKYDCLHLLSGGKDSTYALYRLVDLGFEPYVLTLDNGFISEGAKDNARRSVAELGLDHEFATTDAMNAIFRDSLERHSNVCHGCYKTIYTLATTRAAELGIPMIVTGLSRGQLFETRLIPQQFSEARFDPDAIDHAVIEARKIYHQLDDGPNRLLDTSVFAPPADGEESVFDRIEYLDFYRYIDVELSELFSYLDNNAPWVRPSDTGRSTNCLINAAGIHTHLEERGYHNYAIPYAWDVRLGHKTRQEAIDELDDQLDPLEVNRLLQAVGYLPKPPEILTAWLEVTPGFEAPTPAELRSYLADQLAPHAIPNAFVVVDTLPLSTNGKLDASALPAPARTHRASSGIHLEAETPLEASIIAVWEQILRTEPIGGDDDFFALGGDSLAALEMIVAVADATATVIGDELAFVHTTPRALAAAIELLDQDQAQPKDQGHRASAEERRNTPSRPGAAQSWSLSEPPPLSEGEMAILFEQSVRPSSIMYNVGRQYRIAGGVDAEGLAEALRTVSARHIPLSWSYGATRRPLTPQQAVSVEAPSDAVSPEDLPSIVSVFHREPFELSRGPLLRALIQPMTDGTTTIVLVCHHVACDAESFDRLWHQLDAELANEPAPAAATDYPTYKTWQQDSLTASDRDYWLTAIARPPETPPARLAIAAPLEPAADSFLTKVASVRPDELKAIAGTTGFSIALASLAATLRRYSDGDVVPLGMITSSRVHHEAEPLVGYFLNTIPIEIPCSLDDRLSDIAARTAGSVATSLTHRGYPFSRITADRREAGIASPALDVLVAYDDLPSSKLAGQTVEQRVLSNGTAVADATFFIEVRDDRVDLSLETRSTVLNHDVAAQLLGDFDEMLSAAVRSPLTTVGDPKLESPSSLLAGGELTSPASLLPLILDNVVMRGEETAVVCGGEALSWSDLGQRSAEVRDRLQQCGVVPGQRVVINLSRSIDLATAIVGVLRAGAAYVPVDPTYPQDRIDMITAGATAAAIIDQSTESGESLRIEADPAEQIDAAAPIGHDADIAASDVAYVIFTSGSTGVPRGVPVSHGQLSASTTARDGVYDHRPASFLLISSAAFDSSIVGLFWTLASGGKLVLPTDTESHDPAALIGLLATEQVSHTLMVPTLYQAMLDRSDNAELWPAQVIVAGEACPRPVVDLHLDRWPQSRLTNEYGPTETTVWATAEHCGHDQGPVSIGHPIPGTWVGVVGAGDRPVPVGVEGELIVGGAGVVSGYLNDPEATAARFDDIALGRFFRTGDRAVIRDGKVYFLGRLDDQLNVGGTRAEPADIESALLADPAVGAAIATTFDPRTIEELLAAVSPDVVARSMAEAATNDDPAAELASSLRSASPSDEQLVAHLEAVDGQTIDVEAVRRRVNQLLPPLLRPTAYGVHQRLPRSPNGKLDRAAAGALPVDQPARRTAPTGADADGIERGRAKLGEPQVHVEELATMFADVLRTATVDADESFFDLGGHSLLAMELLLRLERRFGPEVTVSSLYENPTPTALAALIDSLGTGPTQNRFLVPIQPNGSRVPIFGIHVLGVNSEFYRPLAERLGADQPIFGLGQPTLTPDTSAPTDVADVARCYVQELERCAPEGPVVLTAVSLGSVVAYEVAQQLQARGRDVALLGLFDAVGPNIGTVAPSAKGRASLHLDAVRRDPAQYVADRADKVRQRVARRAEIAQLKAKQQLGLDVGDELKIRAFIEANWRSQGEYHYLPYDGAISVFKAGDDHFTADLADGGMGWAEVANGPLQVTVVEGGHISMLEEPHVADLAGALQHQIDVALSSPAAASRVGTERDTPEADQAATTQESAPLESEPLSRDELDQKLRAALHRGEFGTEVERWSLSDRPLDPSAQALLLDAQAASSAIGAQTVGEAEIALSALADAGLAVILAPMPQRLQHHSALIRLDPGSAGVSAAMTVAARALGDLGYRPQDAYSPGAWKAHLAFNPSCTFVRVDDSTMRLNLVWAAQPQPGTLRRLTQPTRADLLARDLPSWAWPAYGALRPARLIKERLLGRTAGSNLGVYLGTPTGLIGDILALATPEANDLIVDIGCGDGRVLIEAVRRYGCRARGIDNDPDLVLRARSAVAAAGLDEQIEIVEGDGANLSLADASIVFTFLPAEMTAHLLARIVADLGPGGRLIAHEQLATAWPIPPDHEELIMNEHGLTVAYRWDGRRP